MKRPPTPVELIDAEWLQNAVKTMNDQDIGKKLGCSPFTVLRWRQKLGISPSLVRPRKNNPFLESRIKEISDMDAARIAMCIDAEGHVGIHPRYERGDERVSLSVVNTSLELINWLGGFGGKTRKRSDSNGRLGKKPLYEWVVYSVSDQLFILKTIEPHSIVKRDSVQEAISWCEARLRGDKSHLESQKA